MSAVKKWGGLRAMFCEEGADVVTGEKWKPAIATTSFFVTGILGVRVYA